VTAAGSGCDCHMLLKVLWNSLMQAAEDDDTQFVRQSSAAVTVKNCMLCTIAV